MNTKRIIVLGLALVAASAAALLARGLFGGGTPKVEAKPVPVIAMSEVLVAASNLQAGKALTPASVRWQKWPAASVDPSFITNNSVAAIGDLVKDSVVRTPVIAGQPITMTAIVHGTAGGFMAAMLTPGMRAVSITISADSGAGGFILPNDRVDLIMIQKSSDGKNSTRARTIMTNVRVLAVDQTFKQEKDANTVIGKTATLELMPGDAELVARAQSQGQISLALRPLTDAQPAAVASAAPVSQATGAPLDNGKDEGRDDENSPDHVAVIRYGVSRGDAPGGGGAEKPRPQ